MTAPDVAALLAPVIPGPHGGKLTFGPPEPRLDLPKVWRPGSAIVTLLGVIPGTEGRWEHRWDRKVYETWTENGQRMGYVCWESDFDRPWEWPQWYQTRGPAR